MDTNSPAPVNPEHKKVGPIVTALVVVLILIIGALYLFASRMNQQDDSLPTDDADMQTATTTDSVQPVTSQSDDMNSIQSDMNASTNGLDQQNF